MKYQRQPTTSFGPRQHLPIKKKRPGPRMMKIIKEVRCRQAYMPLSGANRGGNVENTGCARNGKTYYDSSKSTQLNEGQDIAVVVKPRKYPLGDSVAMANGNIVPLGKSKEVAVSPSSVDLKKSPSCFRNEFSSNVLEKPALHVLKSNSSGANRIAKKSPHSKKILFGKRKAVTSSRGLTILVETPLVLDKVKVVASIQGNVVGHGVHFVDEHHKGQSLKEKLKNPSSRSKCILGTEDFRGSSDIHRRVETSCMGNNTKQNGGPTTEDCRTDNDGFKSKRKGLLEKIPREHSKGSEDTKTSRPVKRRRYICTADEDEDDISGDDRNVICGDDHNITGIEDGTDGFISQTAIVERYGSLPIDEPIWSGMLKIGSEGCFSLEAHLLAKSCEQVWKCSRSLLNMVQVTKLSRLEAEPKCFRVSRPTEDNIGLYFFPQGMRPNEDFDKLVKEVMDNDLILRAAVDEAEMLIFPSILLPEKHQTFQGKHYLWGLFKRREDKVKVEGEEHMRGTSLSGHEKENDYREGRTGSLARSNGSTCPAERAVAEAAAPPPAAAAAASHAPSLQAERAAAVVATPAPAATSHATSSTHPAERAAAEATTPAPAAAAAAMCHAASSVVPHGGMFGFIVGKNPRIQQLIQEIEREGAVVFAMRGETMGYGLGNSAAAE